MQWPSDVDPQAWLPQRRHSHTVCGMTVAFLALTSAALSSPSFFSFSGTIVSAGFIFSAARFCSRRARSNCSRWNIYTISTIGNWLICNLTNPITLSNRISFNNYCISFKINYLQGKIELKGKTVDKLLVTFWSWRVLLPPKMKQISLDYISGAYYFAAVSACATSLELYILLCNCKS